MRNIRDNINLFDDNELQRLVEQLKKGSYKAFDALYKTYFDLLYGYVFRLVRSHESTQEVVQNTFVKIWLNREKLDIDLSFKAYLFKIAKNDIMDGIRKSVSNPVFEDYLSYCNHEKITIHAEQEFDIEMFNLLLNKAKSKLSPRQAEVFELIKENGLTPTETAQKLSLPEQVVYNYLSQALSILRNEMKEMVPFFILFFF
ncbi:MAG: sigma-70 family RNA polymerase sigma factor [Tannerellaceae bacterium]|jgi:RNA polymerase sigma-70 factor (ECF subfamily)|nr:sigma-70 family RNA polymerase sigma factor [Tannerellaceae bacterium]